MQLRNPVSLIVSLTMGVLLVGAFFALAYKFIAIAGTLGFVFVVCALLANSWLLRAEDKQVGGFDEAQSFFDDHEHFEK